MSVSRFWRFNKERYQLTGVRCTNCGAQFFTPHIVCSRCQSDIPDVAESVAPDKPVPVMAQPIGATVFH